MLATGLNLLSVPRFHVGHSMPNLLYSSFVFQALIVGSVFLNSPEATSAYFSRGGVLFLFVLFSCLV